MTDMDSDYIDEPGVFRRIVGIRKAATGTHLILECKHVVMVSTHSMMLKLGDPFACFHCSEKLLTDYMRKYKK